jgi:DNA repair protein RecO (recombination protein O)
MLITTNGLVVARRQFGDTSCFIDVLTKEYSVIEVTAKGVKRLNSPIAQATGLFTYSEFCFAKNNKLRYTVNSAKANLSFHNLSRDLKRLALASYFAELVKFTATPEQDSGNILRLTLIAMYELCRDRYTVEEIKSDYERGLARELGFGDGDLLHHLERDSFKSLDYFKEL